MFCRCFPSAFAPALLSSELCSPNSHLKRIQGRLAIGQLPSRSPHGFASVHFLSPVCLFCILASCCSHTPRGRGMTPLRLRDVPSDCGMAEAMVLDFSRYLAVSHGASLDRVICWCRSENPPNIKPLLPTCPSTASFVQLTSKLSKNNFNFQAFPITPTSTRNCHHV